MIDLLIKLASKFIGLNPSSMIAYGIGAIALIGGATGYGYFLGHGHASDACAADKLVHEQEAAESQREAVREGNRQNQETITRLMLP